MAGVQVPTPPDLGEHRLTKFEGTLRASIADWWNKVSGTRNEIKNRGNTAVAPATFDGWEKTLTRVADEMASASRNLQIVQEDLTAAKAEVEYRASLVEAWPSGSLWDKLPYIATALFGAGGAAFFFFAANLASNPDWYVPAVVIWGAGGVLMTVSLWGLGKADRKRFDFFSYQFEIPEKLKP